MKRILVIGESCRDKTVYGRCNRICPEAPVPVFEYDHEETTMGMSFNVKNNMKALDTTAEVELITNWQLLPVKTRYIDMVSEQMVLRLDEDDSLPPMDIQKKLCEQDLGKFDAVVISDYDKGLLTYDDIAYIASVIDVPLFLDTKKPLKALYFSRVNFIKINEREEKLSIAEGADLTRGEMNIIVTLGKAGCKHNGITYPVPEVEVRNVCGAGDTFLAALVVKYLEEGDITKALPFANTCAAEVVRHQGVTVYGHYH